MKQFSFEPLSTASLDTAIELCDSCVGKNLYSRDYLSTVISRPNHYFFLLVSPEQEAMGYIYFFITNIADMSALSKLPKERLSVISAKKNPVIGNLQSIGVKEAFRGQGLSSRLVRFYLERLYTDAVDTAFGVFWKARGTVPMKQTLVALHFNFLAEVHEVWYDNKDLICPFCNGRCKCDAEIYYKPLEKEAIN